MSAFIEIKEPMISADNLLKRWPGILESELAGMIDRSSDLFENLPTAYRVHKVLNDGRGGIITKCVPCGEKGNYYINYQGNDTCYNFTGIAFILNEISKYEDDNPKLLYQVVTNPDEAWNSSKQVDEYLPIEEVRKSLQLSPYQFVRFLNDDSNSNRLITSWEEGFIAKLMDGGYGGGHVPFFSIEDLSNTDLRVHHLDWKEFQQQSMQGERDILDSEGISFPTATEDTRNSEPQSAEIQKESEVSKDLIAEKDARINELEAQVATTAAEPATTVNATKWGNSVTAAFEVWAYIIAGDKTDWKEDEFRTALAGRYLDYHTEVHAIAWRLLPEAFKHGRGRPKKNPK